MNAAITDVGRMGVGVRRGRRFEELITRQAAAGIAALYPFYALKNAEDFG
jgi:hypothetical protein